MVKKFYLITGGTGFIGSALVKRLVKKGYRVRIFDNNLRGTTERLNKIRDRIEFVEGDIRNFDAISNACKDVDSIVHLAYLNGTKFFYEMPELVLDIGVKGMINIIDACKKNNIRELILASSSEVYQTPPTIPADETVPLIVPDPHNPRYSYGGGKIICELIAINYGRKYFDKVIIFRPHNVYGPDMGYEHVLPQFILRMKKLTDSDQNPLIKFPVQGTGDETRAFVYIDDFIDGLILLMEKGDHLGIYHIGTTDEIRIKDVVKEVGSFFGRKIEIVPGELQIGGTLRRCPDITKIMALGYMPMIPFKVGLKKTIDWYVTNYNKKPIKS